MSVGRRWVLYTSVVALVEAPTFTSAFADENEREESAAEGESRRGLVLLSLPNAGLLPTTVSSTRCKMSLLVLHTVNRKFAIDIQMISRMRDLRALSKARESI